MTISDLINARMLVGEQMKLMLISSSFPDQGRPAGLFLPELIGELNDLGVQVHVLTQNCEASRTVTEVIRKNYSITRFGWHGGDLPLIALSERKILALPLMLEFFSRAMLAGIQIARKWRPDFLLAEWLIPAGLVAMMVSDFTRTPYGARALGSDVMIAAQKPGFRQIVQLVARRASALFADGFDLCARTSELAGGKTCHFSPTSRRLAPAASSYKLKRNAGAFVCCSIGRLHPVKGQDVLVAAMKILQDRGSPVQTVLVGAGPAQKPLTEQIANLGLEDQVFLTGRIEDQDLGALLQQVDAVVIPSRSESIPLVLGEALRAGRPLVVSDVGDMRKLVSSYNLGYVVPPEEPRALADAIDQLRMHPDRSSFTSRADELLELLSVRKSAQTMVTVIAQVLAGQGSS